MFELENQPGNVDIKKYKTSADKHSYVDDLAWIEKEEAENFLDVGIDVSEASRSGTFIQKDASIIHCKTKQRGIDVMKISDAVKTDGQVADYLWKNISADHDDFTSYAKENPHEGYFIRAQKGVKSVDPVQACLHIATESFSQNVHNIVIAEEDSDLHIITGCSTSSHLTSGLHVGVSEFYIKKGATLRFTMIHDWGEKVDVRPRTVAVVEEGGVFVSNYISMNPVGSLQMSPVTYLNGRNAVARFNSILVAGQGTHMDVGSNVVLNEPGSRAEIISRAISTGGTIIARGNLTGKAEGIKAHLECKGLILKGGIIRAIPELDARVPGVEMSHEAAVGKIDRREIEYLMSRGVDEDEAISTIVRGFLNVDIEGLPSSLAGKLDKVVAETQKDAM
ncbi:MAG: SufD family Fe-S cluster assembly protein [Deltaproteobacteria bacterium]|nr:SufD family Fe-S cluster assembly protein [Deltaproteobacteria bacterium]